MSLDLEQPRTRPQHVAFQEARHAWQVVVADFRDRQMSGFEPHTCELFAEQCLDLSSFLPSEFVVQRSVVGSDGTTMLARSAEASVFIRTSARLSEIEVSAAEAPTAARVAQILGARLPRLADDDRVEFRAWFMADDQVTSTQRTLPALNWAEIRRNYPRLVASPVERLMGCHRPEGMGKLILWHGPPGTGKTTALRALMNSWAPWCAAQYIADPEMLFKSPAYIAEVLSRPPTSTLGPIRRQGSAGQVFDPDWRLVIAEDCDEYLRSTARRDAGASLGRLLNLTDGILGQGFNALVLLTTNEEIGRLHPALIRPGRCLARVEFTSFGREEAQKWLDASTSLPDRDLTLAELLALRGDLSNITPTLAPDTSTGRYA